MFFLLTLLSLCSMLWYYFLNFSWWKLYFLTIHSFFQRKISIFLIILYDCLNSFNNLIRIHTTILNLVTVFLHSDTDNDSPNLHCSEAAIWRFSVKNWYRKFYKILWQRPALKSFQKIVIKACLLFLRAVSKDCLEAH